jgi:hypothetical protein
MSSPTISRRALPESSAIRQWAEDRRAASAAEACELAASAPTPAQSFGTALSLLAFYASLNGWPPPDDPIDERDNLEVWARFARLRARLQP